MRTDTLMLTGPLHVLHADRPQVRVSLTWHTTLAGELDFVDAGWLAFTGRALVDELGDGWRDRVHRDDLDTYLESARACVQRGEPLPINFRLLRSDGEYRWLSGRMSPQLDDAGAPRGVVGRAVDIDDQLARSVDDDFFELSLDNLCVAGLDGYFRRVNPAWTRTLGWTSRELMSSPTISFVHPDDRAATLAGRQRLQLGSPLGPLVNRYRCKDGSYRWFEWRSFARADHGLVYASARDITEQKLAQQHLAEAQQREQALQRHLMFADRMASVGTLAAGIAHEINNPLASVSANLSLVLEALASGVDPLQVAELREMASDAYAGAERIRQIVRSLSVFSRAEEERRSTIDLGPLVALSVDMTVHEIRHRARLSTDFGPTPHVEADEARLGQALVNLLLNAAQAIPESDRAEHEIHVRTSTDADGCAVIEVRDTGVGIPANIIGRIFDPFFTTKAVGQGTGLGLSICHTIVTGLGGTISVDSEPGRGATFTVVLPAARAQPPSAPPPRASPREAKARAAVLVVDDEVAVGVVLTRILRDHDVTALTSASAALELLATGRDFDVVFSDLMMPGMSGMDFYDQLSRRSPSTAARVVFMSGGAFTPAARELMAREGHRLIAKPFASAEIRELVARRLRS